MAGLIRREDVEAVRERSRIDEVVGEHVTLKSAGVGSMKGLCPFHDERSPSFHVRPQVGFYHCFGCGEGGDVITFLQKVDHLSFAEAVERLAGRLGYQLRYENDTGGGAGRREDTGRRQRLLDAHRVAEEFYREQLATPGAAPGQQFLDERGFDQTAAEQFGVGFAPQGWDGLQRHLTGRGFSGDELLASGLLSQGQRGSYDRFRGRLVWPIRDITGATVGFGARKLLEDDQGPKYLNTPETAIYHKSQVLYGIDLAKREIAKQRQAVVVEGYTDVMACHLSGVPTAIATCGTAFGGDHAKVIQRLLVDDDTLVGEVIFTFDGDEAGRKAALRAFSEDQRFVARTFVAVEPNGLDPCELRQERGGDAVQALVASRQPLFEFAIKASVRRFDLDTAEGRIQGLQAAVPVVVRLGDPLRKQYALRLAGWLGMPEAEVLGAVQRFGRRDAAEQASLPALATGPHDPVVLAERQILQMILQQPATLPADEAARLTGDAFSSPAHKVLYDAVLAAGGPASAGVGWVEKVADQAPDVVRPLVRELAVAPLLLRAGEAVETLSRRLLLDSRRRDLLRQEADLRGRAQRLEGSGDAAAASAAWAKVVELTTARQALAER
ncbi:MAG TPA: DNA primase [Actinomycetales bacterium]|nr:DNA primase [Actinomycetales bacterium]